MRACKLVLGAHAHRMLCSSWEWLRWEGEQEFKTPVLPDDYLEGLALKRVCLFVRARMAHTWKARVLQKKVARAHMRAVPHVRCLHAELAHPR